MITRSNSSPEEWGAHSISRCSTAHHGDFRTARVRTELDPLLIIPLLAHHPVQTNSQSPCHGDLGDLPSTSHHQVKVSAAPFRKAAYRNLRRLHQQEAQHRTALFRDMSQPALVPTGLFHWNQTEIAGDLLAALKAFRLADDQHKRQCGEGTDSGMRRQSLRRRALLHSKIPAAMPALSLRTVMS